MKLNNQLKKKARKLHRLAKKRAKCYEKLAGIDREIRTAAEELHQLASRENLRNGRQVLFDDEESEEPEPETIDIAAGDPEDLEIETVGIVKEDTASILMPGGTFQIDRGSTFVVISEGEASDEASDCEPMDEPEGPVTDEEEVTDEEVPAVEEPAVFVAAL